MKQWSLPLTTLIVNSDFNRPDGIHVIEYSEYDALAKRVLELGDLINDEDGYIASQRSLMEELTAAKAEIDELETQVGKLAIELGVPPDGWRIKGPKLEAELVAAKKELAAYKLSERLPPRRKCLDCGVESLTGNVHEEACLKTLELKDELVAAKAEIEWLSGSFQEGVNNCCKHTERLKELETQRLEDTSEYMKLEEKFKELEQVIEGKYGGESRLLTAMSMAQQAEHRCRKAEKRVQELEAIDKTDHRYQPCVNEIERLKDREKALVEALERVKMAIKNLWSKASECKHDMQPNTTMDYFRCERCGLPNCIFEALENHKGN